MWTINKMMIGAIIALGIMAFLVSDVFAFVEAPPPTDDATDYNWKQKVQHELNRSNMPFTDTNPNGNRTGQQGDIVWYYTTTGFYLMVCASAPTTWRGTLMLNIIE